MAVFTEDNKEFQTFIDNTNAIITEVTGHAKKEDIRELQRLVSNFKKKTEDFYRTDRMLNIGVIGQVKAGKSTFLNTLLFDGKEVLPKAPTPKTATLTKMEYSDKNIIQIEYYSKEEWEVLEENACVDLEDEIYTSAREIIEMVRRNGVDPVPYLEKGKDILEYESYDALVSGLNNYVGEDGKYTPIVKAVTLYLNKEEFKGLSIVDTPGLNDPIASRTIRTKEFMEVCDVVFFLSPSTGFLDKSDWVLLSSQLPQKGVKKLVLIASRYDSGVRDVLRKQEEDDIFGDDENTTDNVPKACRIVKKKLTKRAKAKVEEFVGDLEARESSPELIEVIRQCAKPIMISSLAYNMIGKAESEFTKEEKNMYSAIRQFSTDMDSDLNLLGNFDEVKALFREVVTEKEHIFEAKAKGFIPDAVEELSNLLLSYQDKTNQRIKLLEGNEKEQLLEQKKLIESQMNNIKADIAAVFGELNAKIESEKAVGIRELRDSSKDYLNIRERTGTETVHESHTVSDSTWYKPWTWGKSHIEHYTYEEHYSYCIAADAIENLKKYALEASNQVEKVFSEALQMKEVKRKLLNVVVNNFDMGSEKYDSSLFRIMVEETISRIEFPVFDMDISDAMSGIAGKFNGELTSAQEKTELSTALSKAISNIYGELCDRLEKEVKTFEIKMSAISQKVEESLLNNITEEFGNLISQCENKENEIAAYKEYAAILEKKLAELKA